MQNVESAMEKGEAGSVGVGGVSPAPTSPTLCNSISGSLKEPPSRTNTQNAVPRRWTWPSWSISRKKKYRTPIIPSRLNDYPKGYPNVSAFLDSAEAFTIYRRFGYLQSRILLEKQEDLRRAEKKLQRMERGMTINNENALCSRDTGGAAKEEHRRLLADIEQTFCSYSNILLAAQQMMALGKPGDSDCESVGQYLNNRKSLNQEEASWVHHRGDLITLKPGREHAWLDGIVEGLLCYCHCSLIDFIFRSKETRKKTEIDSDTMATRPTADGDQIEIYYTPSRIAKLTNGILTMIILVLLVLPIYILYHMVHDIGTRKAYMECIATLLIFTLAFSSVLSLFTKARRHEILAAAAAYCAVLVVFLGNVGPTSSPIL